MPHDELRALSIRPGWAHAILHMGKDIENRTWRTNYSGSLLIHAGRRLVTTDIAELNAIARKLGVAEVSKEDLGVGGIIGVAELVDIVTVSDSQWFHGPFGWRLRNARRLPFLPLPGKLSIFKVAAPVAWRDAAGV